MGKIFRNTWVEEELDLLLLLYDAAKSNDIVNVLNRAWDWPGITGPFPAKNIEPESQKRASIIPAPFDHGWPVLYGTASLPNQSKNDFITHPIVDDRSWIYLTLQLGSPSFTYPVNHTITSYSTPLQGWEVELCDWFVELAHWIFAKTPFDAAIIGSFTEVGLDELLTGIVPDQRYYGYLSANNGQLTYAAPNTV